LPPKENNSQKFLQEKLSKKIVYIYYNNSNIFSVMPLIESVKKTIFSRKKVLTNNPLFK